jgi:hypothetical protein
MSNQLESQIASYQRWREEIRSGIEAYQLWLDQHGHVDIQRSLRIYDLLESLRNDRMVLAFLAEYSRGKTELINAMFFSDFKQRLLPSDVGRTPCARPRSSGIVPATYVRLPIETRKREDNIARSSNDQWVKIKLTSSPTRKCPRRWRAWPRPRPPREERRPGTAGSEGLRHHTVVTRSRWRFPPGATR